MDALSVLAGVASVMTVTRAAIRLSRQLRFIARFNEELEAISAVFQSIQIILAMLPGHDSRAMVDEINDLARELATIQAKEARRLHAPVWKLLVYAIRYAATQKQKRELVARLMIVGSRVEKHLL